MLFAVIFQVHFKYQGKYFVIIGAWNPVNGDILLEYSKLGGEKKESLNSFSIAFFPYFFDGGSMCDVSTMIPGQQ